MNKKSLTIIVLLILGLIVTVIVVDFLNNRPDRRGANPYALDVDQYKDVDPGLISHEETRNLDLGSLQGAAMDFHEGTLYVAGDSALVILRPDGTALERWKILPSPTSILVDDQAVFIGYRSLVARYDHNGNLAASWADLGDRAVITNLAGKGDRIYVADAGNRKVWVYSREGEQITGFAGEAQTEAGHGFIVPSPNFDLAVDSYGELWVVNPGKHALENYTDDGRMRGYWEHMSTGPEGFLGCCNPARITAASDGRFVTSEKGLVRIKVYDESGALKSVVAPPTLFKEEGRAPDVCVDSRMVVYALDYDRNMIRIFKPREDG